MEHCPLGRGCNIRTPPPPPPARLLFPSPPPIVFHAQFCPPLSSLRCCSSPPLVDPSCYQVDNVFGRMKQRDANDVLGDIAKQDRRANRARQSIAPAPVCFFTTPVFRFCSSGPSLSPPTAPSGRLTSVPCWLIERSRSKRCPCV